MRRRSARAAIAASGSRPRRRRWYTALPFDLLRTFLPLKSEALASAAKSGVRDLPPYLADIDEVGAIPRKPLHFLLRLMSQFKVRLGLMVLFAAVTGAGESLAPRALGMLVDVLNVAGRGAVVQDFSVPLLLLVGAWLLAHAGHRAYEIVDVYASPRLRVRALHMLSGYVLGHAPSYFQTNLTGKLAQAIRLGSNACVPLTNITCFETVRLLVLACFADVLLWRQDYSLSLVLSGWAILQLGLTIWLASKIVVLSKAFSDEMTTSSGNLVDVLSNVETVRAFAQVRSERSRLARSLHTEQVRAESLRRYHAVLHLSQSIGIVTMLVAVAWFGISGVLSHHLTVGGFAMAMMLAAVLATIVQGLASHSIVFFEHTGNLSEALRILVQPYEIADRPGAEPLRFEDGAIRFDKVSFSYPNGSRVFDGLDLSIAPGERVGLVGPSGAGKSTLIRLLRRHFEPQSGRIFIDGQDIAGVTLMSLNEAMAEVPQTPGMFNRSIAENIGYGVPGAEFERIARAAMLANADHFISACPEGFDTVVGERGTKLSGGERQRIAIARASLRGGRMLLLDEATNALDSGTEGLVQEALLRLMEGRTVIAIAHRLSTICGMDRLIYLEDGRILEQGSHASLLAKGGAYARLWRQQYEAGLAPETSGAKRDQHLPRVVRLGEGE